MQEGEYEMFGPLCPIMAILADDSLYFSTGMELQTGFERMAAMASLGTGPGWGQWALLQAATGGCRWGDLALQWTGPAVASWSTGLGHALVHSYGRWLGGTVGVAPI